MRSRWLRLLPLFVAAFWLPFQAVAGMGLSSCRHGEAHQPAATEDGAAEHCQMHERQATAEDPGAVADLADLVDLVTFACDNCEACHLAGAGFMPSPEYVAAVIASGYDFRPDVELAPASAIPEPPQQPPRRLA